MKLGIVLYEQLIGHNALDFVIDTEGVVKQWHPIDHKKLNKDQFVFLCLQTSKGKLTQQQYTSAMVLITAMMLNWKLDASDIVSKDTSWDEIRRKG
jgi:hypothetical protein